MGKAPKTVLCIGLAFVLWAICALGVGTTTAWATTTGNGTATCTTASGKLTFRPPLRPTGTSSVETVHLKLDVTGCTLTANTNVVDLPLGRIITHWAISGTNVNRCAAALPASGTVPVPMSVVWHGPVVAPNTPPLVDTTFTTTGEDWAPTATPPTLTLPVTASALGSFPLFPAPTMTVDLSPTVSCGTVLKAYRITGFATPTVSF